MRIRSFAWLHQHLSLTAFDVPRPACVRPVTRLMPVPDLLAVPAHVAPAEGDMAAQLLFALKHEGVNLQILAQAMPHLSAQSLLAALAATPNGRYARVLAHLWETLRGEPLTQRPPVSGAYVDVFDSRRYVTGTAQRDPRWRVNFNGLGTASYCATVERTPPSTRAWPPTCWAAPPPSSTGWTPSCSTGRWAVLPARNRGLLRHRARKAQHFCNLHGFKKAHRHHPLLNP